MNSPGPPVLFWVFVAVWAALGVTGWWFFSRSRDLDLKRRVLRWGAIAVGVLFTGFVLVMTGEPWVLWIVAPTVALISFLSIRFTKFCPSCGATLYNYNWFVAMRYCSRCGTRLDNPDPQGGGA